MDSKPTVIPSAGPDFEHLLAQDVVIEAGSQASTGAQSVAPDHSPRAPQLGVGAPLRLGQATPAAPLLAEGGLQREVEQFLYRQAELLDGKHWQAFIDLFDEQGVYWMPVTPEQVEWEGSPSIFAEDRRMMEIRKGRVNHPNAWSQAPDWETSHLVSHVMLESAGDEIVVRSRFHMMELRRDEIRHFGGRYRHTLVRDAQGQLRIRLQRVDLFNGQAPYDYVLQVWV
ncbi:aromatic-ring-hydroxylating dioxygenase subunit beta [Ramlibacter sp. USB13]|uniref:Aromatic-ring-hydroxylating dioxygenase subunit beta n=1 Tax=Ramlibacter cellulosilyticus TaxID=2764187 RepID=A0A923MT26_9BURK|nr:aromatic-ring-hydroxylating dioxygenase subunit beta [Ramlibacter cellulosilyticus]MBC5785312.1 aromatic-ring-hydroxylating dioxygenase subunit beta [Ramlibacter cellulosilyticus]